MYNLYVYFANYYSLKLGDFYKPLILTNYSCTVHKYMVEFSGYRNPLRLIFKLLPY